MNIKYIDTGTLYEGLKGAVVNNSTRISQKNGIPYIEFTPFDEFDWVTLHFSTRDGGVSKGIYSSMNFSFDRGDDYENVYKNYELFLDTMNIKPENCVCTKQTHTTNVIAVDYNMAGMGLTRARNFDNVDGLVTNEPGLCLITYFADCVPVYFIDPVNRCIGASHSGWRGTVADITHETVQLMNRTYGSKPENIHAFIGPSICQDCYEVDEAVAEKFRSAYSRNEIGMILYHTTGDKYQLNLQAANYFNMIHAGIKPDNIGISDICTSCNSDWLFSHRASHGKRGVLLIICSGFFYFLLCSCLYLALNSASSEESFDRLFLPTLVISRYIAASIAIGIAAVSIVDKVSVNTPFSNMDFFTSVYWAELIMYLMSLIISSVISLSFD